MRRRSLFGIGMALIAWVAAGCGDDNGKAAEPVKVSPAGVYAAVIRSLLPAPTVGQKPEDRHVYVVARGAGVTVGLEVQANVVRRLDDEARVRWVDDVDEALQGEEEGAPVRDEGIVVGLGPVPEAPPPVEVYADWAARRGSVEAFLYTVTLEGEEWAVVRQTATVPQADLRA